MKSPIVVSPSLGSTFVAASIARPDKTSIDVLPLDYLLAHKEGEEEEKGEGEGGLSPQPGKFEIDFLNGEQVAAFKWLSVPKGSDERGSTAATAAPNVSKRRRDSFPLEKTTPDFIDYLVILLTTGEILVYSTFLKEFTNKISSDSNFSAMEVMSNTGDHNIVVFDSSVSSVKFFQSNSPQIVSTIPFKEDANISCILSLENDDLQLNLILASSSAIYIINLKGEIIDKIDISLPESGTVNSKQRLPAFDNSTPILKMAKHKNEDILYLTRKNNAIIQVVDLKSKTSRFLTASTTITDISILRTNNSYIIAATLLGGSVELFSPRSEETSSYARLEIEGGKDIGKFVGLLDSNNIIDGVYKGVWYDHFNIQITDIEFDDISALDGTIRISVTDSGDDELLELSDGESSGNDEYYEADETFTKPKNVDNLQCTDLKEFSQLIRQKLILPDLDNERDDVNKNEYFTELLAQNTTFAKPIIHTLSVDETKILFNRVAYLVSQFPSSINQDFTIVSNVKQWLKWILILRGSAIINDDESIGWLKLLRSEFNQEAKVLNNMVKLTGKLTLLKDQLEIRKEMMKAAGSNGEADGENEADDVNNDSGSDSEDDAINVMDGEGGFGEEEADDDDSDNEDDDEDDDEADDNAATE